MVKGERYLQCRVLEGILQAEVNLIQLKFYFMQFEQMPQT